MIRVGFIGRTKMLYDAIDLFSQLDNYEISFIWTCKDEEYYEFNSKNFESLAKKLDAEFVSSADVLKFSHRVDADVVVSINFVNVIPKKFIDKFKYGIANAHAGDLPRYRGNACPNWAILNQEDDVVLSFHLMDEGLDSGPVISKERFKLREDTYIDEVYEWFEKVVPQGFVKSVDKLISNSLLEEQRGKPLRTFPRKPEDSKLNFDADLEWNYRLIRASSRPFSGAYAFLNNTETKVIIHRAIPHFVSYDFCAISGQIMEKSERDHSFLVAIGETVLKVIDYSVGNEPIDVSFKIVCSSMRNRLT
jgi:methionyl-tRNA formyltransferase